MLVEVIGYVAGTLTTIAFLPQVLKAWRTKSTRDVSLGMFLLFTIGVSLWLMYGVLKGDYPIVIANAVTVSLAAMILGMKIKYG